MDASELELFRQHLLAAQRSVLADVDAIGYETQRLAVGFVDLVGFTEACRDHPLLPSVRAGLAIGRVMLRDGDVFGPGVNLAARLAKAAQPGEVVATADVAAASGVLSETRGRHRLKGSTDDVELRRLIRN